MKSALLSSLSIACLLSPAWAEEEAAPAAVGTAEAAENQAASVASSNEAATADAATGGAATGATEMPTPMPVEPTAQHRWLERFVGRWESTSTCSMNPAQPVQGHGEEVVRSLGGLWVVAEGRGEMGPMSMNYLMTLGYDAAKKKFVGIWVDSVTGVMWNYQGSVDETTNTLTLESEGPMPDGSTVKMRDTTVFVDANHRTFTSEMQGPDGQWMTMVSGEAHRVETE